MNNYAPPIHGGAFLCILTKAFGKRSLTKRIFDLHNNSVFFYRLCTIDIFLSIFPKIGLLFAPDTDQRFAKGRTFEMLRKISLLRNFYLEKVRPKASRNFPEKPAVGSPRGLCLKTFKLTEVLETFFLKSRPD